MMALFLASVVSVNGAGKAKSVIKKAASPVKKIVKNNQPALKRVKAKVLNNNPGLAKKPGQALVQALAARKNTPTAAQIKNALESKTLTEDQAKTAVAPSTESNPGPASSGIFAETTKPATGVVTDPVSGTSAVTGAAAEPTTTVAS
jgi:hypothetical protein